MSPYRDPLASLRARSAELDRLLAERRREAEELRAHPLPSSFPLYVLAGVVLVAAGIMAWVSWTMVKERPDPRSPAPLHWNAKVLSGNREGLARGTDCTVEVSAPCTAVVRCGAFGYRAEGRCEDCSFFADGNPACHIDVISGHAFLRGVVQHHQGIPAESWWADSVQR